jgi:hypothetical protein
MQTYLETYLEMNKYKNMVNEYCYFGYKWKGNLSKITNYTHNNLFYKFENNGRYILQSIEVLISCENFKIVNVIVYHIIYLSDIDIIDNYADNADNYSLNVNTLSDYVLHNNNKKNINKYIFKIIENDNIFTITDNNYNIFKINDYLESDYLGGYNDSRIPINNILNNFIEVSK